jgi:hypothetical protein|tara:strand:- start:230 stop:475 length:246 start_codon:yes stop_codon:yes gene_type:complete
MSALQRYPFLYDDIGLVPVAPQWPGACRQRVGRLRLLLWVERFEYDRGADGLSRILQHPENQGLAVMEAVARGCLLVVPGR